jgi:hypothetical protein
MPTLTLLELIVADLTLGGVTSLIFKYVPEISLPCTTGTNNFIYHPSLLWFSSAVSLFTHIWIMEGATNRTRNSDKESLRGFNKDFVNIWALVMSVITFCRLFY